MTQDWILDVLSDLRTFAALNDMSALVEQLDDTLIVASTVVAEKAAANRAGADGKAPEKFIPPQSIDDMP